jgi:hypothetical protein
MPLIYSEGKDKVINRHREEINKALKGKVCPPIMRIYLGIAKLLTGLGHKREDFLVTFSLSNVFDVDYFVAREDELSKIR